MIYQPISYKPSCFRPSSLLHIEEAALLLLTLIAYRHVDPSWLLFAILFLTPDLVMLGYLIKSTHRSRHLQPRPHPYSSPCSSPDRLTEHWSVATAIAQYGQPTSLSISSSATASNIQPFSKTPSPAHLNPPQLDITKAAG
jgi:hypothetical protein